MSDINFFLAGRNDFDYVSTKKIRERVFMPLLLAACINFLINIPFGYWRANIKRFSLQWFLSIHLPIPIIILIRIFTGIGFEFITYIIMIIAFFLGQLTGTKYYAKRITFFPEPVTSCLFMDTYRRLRS